MNRILFLFSLLFLTASAFTSCNEDKYLDWKYMNEQWLVQHNQDAGWITAPSGLQYKVIYEGDGDLKPHNKSYVTLECTGWYITGKTFQETTTYGDYLSNQVHGFQEGLKMMKENAIYEFRLPQEIGYGKNGKSPVPPYSTLIFRVTLHSFVTAY